MPRPPACPPAGRLLSLQLAKIGKGWQRSAAERMPSATGDIREIVGQPVFVPLFKLYQIYGKIFKLSFGPKQFVIVSDPQIAKHVRRAAQWGGSGGRRSHAACIYVLVAGGAVGPGGLLQHPPSPSYLPA